MRKDDEQNVGRGNPYTEKSSLDIQTRIQITFFGERNQSGTLQAVEQLRRKGYSIGDVKIFLEKWGYQPAISEDNGVSQLSFTAEEINDETLALFAELQHASNKYGDELALGTLRSPFFLDSYVDKSEKLEKQLKAAPQHTYTVVWN